MSEKNTREQERLLMKDELTVQKECEARMYEYLSSNQRRKV